MKGNAQERTMKIGGKTYAFGKDTKFTIHNAETNEDITGFTIEKVAMKSNVQERTIKIGGKTYMFDKDAKFTLHNTETNEDVASFTIEKNDDEIITWFGDVGIGWVEREEG